MGVGESFIDHAAGLPLSSRQPSMHSLAMTSATYAPSGRSAPHTPLDNASHDSVRPQFAFVDDPVELPMKSRAKSYVLMGAVIAAFLAVFLTVVLSGGRTAPSSAPSEAAAPPARAAAPR